MHLVYWRKTLVNVFLVDCILMQLLDDKLMPVTDRLFV